MDLLSLLPSRKRDGLHPVVRGLLEQAVEQRSVMQVTFTDPELASGRFAGACAEFDEKTLLVDVALHKNLSAWIGEAVQVRFKIDSKRTTSYYQFASHLRALSRLGASFGMVLASPEAILSNQKRSFVRIAPRKEVIFGVGIWELKPTQTHLGDPTSLGTALVSYRQDHQKELVLLNLSAGGVCLKVQRSHEEDLSAALQPDDRLLCLMMLGSQDGEQTLSLWLESTVMNRRELTSEPYAVLGLRFDAWGAVPTQVKGSTSTVQWFGVGEDGAISSLATWILRQQFQQLHPIKAR